MLKICIYIGINAHVTPADAQTDRHTDTHGKVEQYSAEAESAIYVFHHVFGQTCLLFICLRNSPSSRWVLSGTAKSRLLSFPVSFDVLFFARLDDENNDINNNFDLQMATCNNNGIRDACRTADIIDCHRLP